MSQWKWNDVALDVDMGDADFQEKYENAFIRIEKAEKNLVKTGRLADITRSYCSLYHDFFDNIFGEGTSEKLFQGKMNSNMCEDCYDSFIRTCNAQVKDINTKRAKRFSKYKVKRK